MQNHRYNPTAFVPKDGVIVFSVAHAPNQQLLCTLAFEVCGMIDVKNGSPHLKPACDRWALFMGDTQFDTYGHFSPNLM